MILNMEFETDQPFDFQFGDWLLALLDDPNSVKYTLQEGKTDAEKAQVRQNIAVAVDVITSDDYNAPKRLIDLPAGNHELTGYFAYNAQSDEDGVIFNHDLVLVKRYDVEACVLIQGFRGRTLHSIFVWPDAVQHDEKPIIDESAPIGFVWDPEPTKQLNCYILSKLYKPSLYTSLMGAVADLNAGSTDNAKATADNAVCAIYTDFDGNTCLTLLSDIELNSSVDITSSVIMKVNGYTISYAGDYSLKFSGDRDTLDCRTKGSRLEKHIQASSSVVHTVDFSGGYGELLGGEIVYSSVSYSAFNRIVVNNKNNQLLIDGCKITANFGNGSHYAYAVFAAGNLSIVNTSIDVTSNNVINNGEAALVPIYAVNIASSVSVDNCDINAVSTGSMNLYGIMFITPTVGTPTYDIRNSRLYAAAPYSTAAGIQTYQGTDVEISNVNVYADGTNGGTGISNDDANTILGYSVGITNGGRMVLDNCVVFGTLTGVQCSNGSHTVINGGVYDGVGHGGVYLAHVGGSFYARNATFRCVPYNGKYMDIYEYINADYLNAALYMSRDVDGLKGYLDNCILDGGQRHTHGVDSEGDSYGGDPFRMKSGGTNRALYLSNCVLKGVGKLRFGSPTDRLYLGFANSVTQQSNLPSNPECIDTTTYAKKVFTSYEEE